MPMFHALHNPEHRNYRQSICRHWKRNGGKCERGNFCNFAHGHSELRGHRNEVKNVVTLGKDQGTMSPSALCPSNDIEIYTHITGGYVKINMDEVVEVV